MGIVLAVPKFCVQEARPRRVNTKRSETRKSLCRGPVTALCRYHQRDVYKRQGLNESSRLKAHGPLGEVELKPVKSATKQHLLIVNPATAAKLQDAKNPQKVANPAAEEAQKRMEEAIASGDKEAQTKARCV